MKWLNGKVTHKILASDHRYQNGTANVHQNHNGHLKNFNTTTAPPPPVTIVTPTPQSPETKSNIANDNNNNNNNNNNSRTRITTTRRTNITTSPHNRKKRVIQRRRNNVNVKHSTAGEFDAQQVKRFLFLQSRIYLLSSLIGHRQAPYNSRKGVFGLILWIVNLTIHFGLDFYEAVTVFHFSWASSIGVFLVMFVVCTVFLIRHTLKWFLKTLKRLSKDKIYNSTFSKLYFVFKLSPYGMFALSVSGAGFQYGCYAYDDALTVSFTKTGVNGSVVELVPHAAHIFINIARFTSLMHIYYMMFMLLGIALIIFFTIVHTQRLFNAHIGNELKAHPPSMTFQEAVDKVASRTKLLRNASENTTIIFSTLLITTSLSFVVNAYNFLFIKRYAIYIWFAIAPLLWTVSIMIGSAFVTSSYQKLKLVVMQSWVEIPEKYDELWGRRANSNRTNTATTIHRTPNLDWRTGLENMRRRKAEREAAEEAAIFQELENTTMTTGVIEDNTEGVYVNKLIDGRIVDFTNSNSHVVDIHDRLENTKGIDLFASTVRNINLVNRFLKKPTENLDKTDNEDEDFNDRMARLSMYDNVKEDETLACSLNDVLNSETGEESSYISGKEFRETTSSSAETANEHETLSRGGCRRIAEASSDTVCSDINQTTTGHNKDEEQDDVHCQQKRGHNGAGATTSKTLKSRRASSKSARNLSLPSVRFLSSGSIKDEENSSETSTKVEKNHKSKHIRLRRLSKKVKNNVDLLKNTVEDPVDVKSDDSFGPNDGAGCDEGEALQRKTSVKFGQVVRIAQQVNKFTDNSKKVHNRRKFNYEKYIKYLELTLDTVGFSLGKVTITWDRVSFFIVLLMSLVGVFAQNAFLK